ncbi:hypothetical protein [Erythrobacter westpacificensis]|uniref:hypothetical protein n=1 Tax=Erythrobacter westpacificensis TaxID=1055231 RepID=UPI0031F895AF
MPLRRRKDGWTIKRQCEFLACHYLTGNVSAAAKAAGMSRMSAYRLRRRRDAASFAHAWDAELTPPGEGWIKSEVDWRKVTSEELFRRIDVGLVAPLIHRGKVCAERRKADDSALLRLLKRLDTANARSSEEEPGA